MKKSILLLVLSSLVFSSCFTALATLKNDCKLTTSYVGTRATVCAQCDSVSLQQVLQLAKKLPAQSTTK